MPGGQGHTTLWKSAGSRPSARLREPARLGELKRIRLFAVAAVISTTICRIEQSQIEDFLTRRGFTHVVGVNAEQLKRLYCTGPNQGRAVAENYAIVHAQVEESQVGDSHGVS